MKKLILGAAIAVICASAFAAQAFHTGRQEMVQTVTYQMAWRCQYNYNGQLFWRVFKDMCPPMIDVE